MSEFDGLHRARTRHRVRGVEIKPLVGAVRRFQISTGQTILVASDPVIAYKYKRFSDLTDKVNYPKSWNPCQHLFITQFGGEREHPCPIIPSGFDPGWPGYYTRPLLQDYYQILNGMPSLLEDDEYDDWLYRQFRDMTKMFPSEMSLANSLIELKNGVKEFLPSMEDLRQSIAGNFLKFKFGVMPVLKDLKDSMNVWGNFKKRLDFLEENKGQTFRFRRKHSAEGSANALSIESDWIFPAPQMPEPPPGQFNDYFFQAHDNFTLYECEEQSSKWVLNAFISDEVGDMNSLVQQADAFGRVLGLNNLPKIAWNAYPWTWLFDWFVDTDRILDQFDNTEPFEGKLALQACHLGATHRLHGRLQSKCQHDAYHDDGGFLLKVYQRVTGITQAELDTSLVQPSLDGDQQSILLALLIQRSKAIPDWETIYRKIKRMR